MKRNVSIFLTLAIMVIVSSCQKDEDHHTGDLDASLRKLLLSQAEGRGLRYFMLPESHDFAAIPQDPKNLLSEAKVTLGKHLFHESALGIRPRNIVGLESYSCASCHHSRAGFQAGRRQGIGEGGIGFGRFGETRDLDVRYLVDSIDVQPIRTPTAMNGAYQKNQLWNGQFGATEFNVGTEQSWTAGTPKAVNHLGFEGLETQAIAGQTVHRLDVDPQFCESTEYKHYFEKAFPGVPANELYTREKAGLAIAAYERTILSNRAPFQQWLRGIDRAMFDEEKRGAIIFFGKGKCSTCHTGPALNSMAFYALGMADLDGHGTYGTTGDKTEHLGRGGFTGRAEDNYKFKVPQLYNLKDSPFLGHGADFTSVREVVEYKNRAVPQNQRVPGAHLASEFVPLGLTDAEITALTRFVESALHDPDLHRYDPVTLPSGFCFPNNDIHSRADLGCQ